MIAKDLKARGTAHRVRASSAWTAGSAWWTSGWRPVRIMIGVAATAVVVALFSLADAPLQYRPGALMVAVVAALAVFTGTAGAIAGTITALLGMWIVLLPPRWSLRVGDRPDRLSLVLFLVAASAVLVLVLRLTRSRGAERDQRAELDALLDHTPVGIALYDLNLRYRRLNRHLAALNHREPADHLGRTPVEVLGEEARDIERTLMQVRDTGRPVFDQWLSGHRSGNLGHFLVSFFPIPGRDGNTAGLGVTVDDVTSTVSAAEWAEVMARCAQQLAGVITTEHVAETITPVLATVLSARVALAVRTRDGAGFELVSLAGYPDGPEAQWRGRRWGVFERNPLTDAARRRGWIELRNDAELSRAYPGLNDERFLGGDMATVTVPLRDVLVSGGVVAVLHLAWPHPFELDQEQRRFLETIVPLTELAVSRVRLAEQQERDVFRAALDAMLDRVAFATAVRSENARIDDFVVEFVNRPATGGAWAGAPAVVGRSVLDLNPAWATSGMFERMVAVVETGVPYVQEDVPYSGPAPDGEHIDGYWKLQVSKFGDGYLAVWRDVTEDVRAAEQLRAAREASLQERTSMRVLLAASLPTHLPSHPDVGIVARYLPAASNSVVGGDWYDAFDLDDGRIGLVVADIAGHGPEAAAYMVQLRNKLRGLAYAHRDPGHVLRLFSALTRRTGTLATCCYAILDADSGWLQLANAGHPPPVVAGQMGATPLATTPNPLLGIVASRTYSTLEHQLQAGDVLVMYTDGLVERRRECIDDGLERLRRALEPSGGDTADVADRVLREVLEPGHDDDVCLLLTSFRSAVASPVELPGDAIRPLLLRGGS